MTELDSSRQVTHTLPDENGGRRRPEVLYLTHHLPWPEYSGGRIREAQLLSRLAHRFAIDVVAISKTPDRDRAAAGLTRVAGVEPHIFAAERGPWFAGPLTHRHGSRVARSYLAHRLQSLRTIVHVEGHYLVHLLPKFARHRIIVVEHNVESSLLAQSADASKSLSSRVALASQTLWTRRTERAVWHCARVLGAVTVDDAEVISRVAPQADVRLLPNGCDHIERASTPGSSTSGSHLLFVGNFSYTPNLDAARVLVTEIFPAVVRRHPATQLTVVGADPPVWLVRTAHNDRRITLSGWVPDLAASLDSADVIVCPLRIGGGIKVKVLEALQRGKAIVTTPVGAQGLDHLCGGCAVVVCETSAALASACVRLLAFAQVRQAQERRALTAARELPTWDEAADALAACWLTTENTLDSVADGNDVLRRGR